MNALIALSKLFLRNLVTGALVCSGIALAGCNHAKVMSQQEAQHAPTHLGKDGIAPTIYVSPFATRAAQVQVDPGGPLQRLMAGSPLRERQEGGLLGGLFNPHGGQDNPYQSSEQVSQVEVAAANNMQKDLVNALRAAGLTVHSAMEFELDTDVPNALLLTGQFLTIDEGEKGKRIVIGLGAGASFLETEVQLRDAMYPDTMPLLSFTTQGDSGMAPGALVSGGVGAAAGGMAAAGAGVSGARGAMSGTARDVEQTATQIASYIKQYYQQQGWLPKN